jgi:hypothetical protein
MWWYTVAILPLVYGLPKAAYWVFKGRLKKRALALYVATAVTWNLIFLLIAIAMAYWTPGALRYLRDSQPFAISQLAGLLFMVARSLSASGRKDLNLDFWELMKRKQVLVT